MKDEAERRADSEAGEVGARRCREAGGLKVGLCGLGRMGSAIAGRVAGGGHDLVVYNRTPGKAPPAGARVASSIAEACEGREAVITMVADDDALREVALGAGGLRDSLPDGAIHVPMGTHGVGVIEELDAAHAKAGQVLVAVPVLGRPAVAAEGQLGLVPAGPREAVERLRPLFEVIGRRVIEAGERPAGATAVKLAHNFVLGAAIETMGEAFALVRKYGIEPQVLLDVLTDVLFDAPAYKVYGRIIAEQAYDDVGFTVSLALKDANLILAAADAARVPMPSANVYRDRLLSALAHGDGELDWAVIAREQAQASGLE
jgi:3-hydroxyisobutyrate dehydrogenase-like beta-hydroxyacid dehydrogenase